jgi:hypothetical protein
MEKRAPTTLTCPPYGAALRHVHTIAHVGDLPDVEIFYSAACSHMETMKLRRAA